MTDQLTGSPLVGPQGLCLSLDWPLLEGQCASVVMVELAVGCLDSTLKLGVTFFAQCRLSFCQAL